MIVVLHKNNRISSVFSKENTTISFDKNKTIAEGILDIASQFSKSKIVWCHQNVKEQLDLEVIESLFHHNKMMFSYNPNENNYLGTKIGYVEDTPFIKINKKVHYPTWQMSSLVGALHASVLLEIKDKISPDFDFDYYLSSVAKVCMTLGLLCYSEPKLLRESESKTRIDPASTFTLFKFVKQHYKTRWAFLLFLNLMIYERSFSILALIYSLFYKNRNKKSISLDAIKVESSLKVVNENTIDVIIPTIGRKKQLYDVLQDLAHQTHLPQNVIIVEQNPLENSVSELDYLLNETWPFFINHSFTHRAGACNARNIASGHAKSEWVFLADDDIRIDKTFLYEGLRKINDFEIEACQFCCLIQFEKNDYDKIHQTTIFGSGCSFVKSHNLKNIAFDSRYEFGYGEDFDFGMQLRNSGVDVVYFPEPSILHLKVPIGGFRIKPAFDWDKEMILPKPSPTVMLNALCYKTKEQFLGYKTIYFLKLFSKNKLQNPFTFIRETRKNWRASVYWAKKLNGND
jgi:GT2 family glycosyltransferase